MLRTFTVDATDPLHPAVEIDGLTLPPLRRVAVDWRENNPPVVYLEAVADGMIVGEGVITQVVHEPADQRETVMAWLGRLDPQELESAILERGGFGANETVGASCLAVLKGWANGD